jgi:uncharacterized protein YukE
MAKKICLLIECQDKCIFTSKKNTKLLIEFVKNFNLKIHYAKTDESNIVSVDKIPEIFCNQNPQIKPEYEIVKKNILNKSQSRQNILQTASDIRSKIEKIIMKQEKISFSELQNKFEKYNLSTSTLNNLFRQVRNNLQNTGVKVIKIKNGYYQVEKQNNKS